jgi:hypothetical protein
MCTNFKLNVARVKLGRLEREAKAVIREVIAKVTVCESPNARLASPMYIAHVDLHS